jgi:hypothetical protein
MNGFVKLRAISNLSIFIHVPCIGRDRSSSLILKSKLNILPCWAWAKMNLISVLLYRTKQLYINKLSVSDTNAAIRNWSKYKFFEELKVKQPRINMLIENINSERLQRKTNEFAVSKHLLYTTKHLYNISNRDIPVLKPFISLRVFKQKYFKLSRRTNCQNIVTENNLLLLQWLLDYIIKPLYHSR